MIQKIKQLLFISLAGTTLLMPVLTCAVLSSSVVSADNIQTSLCTGADSAAGTSNTCTQTNTDNGTSALQTLATTVVKWISIVVGAVSIVMIIYGGFRYITSGGDSGRVGSAKNTIIYAIIGLIIVALAQLLVRFVLSTANNQSQGLSG